MSEENINLPLTLVEEIIFDERQKNIFVGLKKFREDIAILYIDGVKLYKSSIFQSKSNLLGHIAREIDFGIRYNLTTKSETEKNAKKFSTPELEKIETYNKSYKGHIISIITSLNGDLSSPMVNEWIDVATQFHKYAHISKKEMKIKNPEKIEILWERFEDVLYWLIGSYYDYLKRIDRILEYETPDTVTLNGLKNILADENLKRYFFINLKSLFWLKDLNEEGYFKINTIKDTFEYPDKPGTRGTPQWWPLNYLKYVSKENYAKNRKGTTRILLEIISNYIDEYDNFNNFVTDEGMLEVIYYLPSREIEIEHINFIRTVILSHSSEKYFIGSDLKEIFFPNLIKDKNEVILQVIDLIFDFENRSGNIFPIFDRESMQDILKSYLEPIISIFGVRALNVVLSKINSIGKINPHFLTFQVIADDNDIFNDDYGHQLLVCVREMFKIMETENLISILEELITEDPVMQKIAINGIETHYNNACDGKKVKNFFWSMDENPLKIHGLRPEIFSLLQKHHLIFTEDENTILIDWIDNYDIPIPKEDLSYKKEIEAADKLKWLEAVKDSQDKRIQEMYIKLKGIYPDEIKMPDRYITYSGLHAPKKPLELCQKSNEDIVNFLINSGNERLSFRDDGEYYSLESCIEDNPVKFSTNLKPFLQCSLDIQYYLLFGLFRAINNKKYFELTQLFEFIENIIKTDSFWSYNNKSDRMNYRDEFISMICDIISTRTELPNMIDMDIIRKMTEILILLEEDKEYTLSEMDGIVSSVINSINGKLYRAMIYLSLHYANNYKKDSSEKWITEIEENFTKNLNYPSIEFSMIIGLYLSNLFYLSPKWISKNFKEVFEKNKDIVLIGYFRTDKFRLNLYKLLKENNIFKYAIKKNFDDKNTNKMVVDHICAAYVKDLEELSNQNSLIFRLIHNNSFELHSEQLYEVSRFIRINKSEMNQEQIRSLWKEIFLVTSINPGKYKKVLSNLLRLLEIFDQFDEELYKWTMLSVQYIEVENSSRYISKYLLKFADDSPDKVAKIFIEILNTDVLPSHQENTRLLVEKLYENGEKSSADIICNKYGENNLHFLRELYELHKEL